MTSQPEPHTDLTGQQLDALAEQYRAKAGPPDHSRPLAVDDPAELAKRLDRIHVSEPSTEHHRLHPEIDPTLPKTEQVEEFLDKCTPRYAPPDWDRHSEPETTSGPDLDR